MVNNEPPPRLEVIYITNLIITVAKKICIIASFKKFGIVRENMLQ
jgi:hypothetical protein